LKLLDDKVDCKIVRVLAYWYSHQQSFVRWNNSVSSCFSYSNGTRQGGVLSPYLFTRYIRELIGDIISAGVGCKMYVWTDC